MAHLLASNISGVAELQIENSEATELAQASLDVMKLYGIQGPSEHMAAWLALGAVLGKTYTPRLTAYKLRTAMERKNKRAADLGNSEPPPSPGASAIITSPGAPLPSYSAPKPDGLN